MRVIYFNARGSRHILGGDFRLFQSGSHLSFLRHISFIVFLISSDFKEVLTKCPKITKKESCKNFCHRNDHQY